MKCPHCDKPLTVVGKFTICPEHGHVDQTQATKPVGDKKIFLSYGRADALDFTLKLARDLEQHGYFAWFDMEDIEKGGLFEVRIEQGIRQAQVFAAVMTPASVREKSVCRDEVVYALNQSKLVVPLKAHADVKPTLLLARRNWIDFTAGYEQGLADLLGFLAGDAKALLPPWLPTVSGVAPLDFAPEIARFSAGFTGRTWLTQEIDQWLARDGPRAMVIVGEPGLGKSAIAAWLSANRADVAAVHFCIDRNTRSLDPQDFVASLVGQLEVSLPGYGQAVEDSDPARRRDSGNDAFRELIVQPTRGLTTPPQARLIIVDSLDEAWAQEGEKIVDVLVRQAPDLPSWLRLVTTTRPEQPILERIRALHVFELSAQRSENRADVRTYIHARLNDSPHAATAPRLDELAAGNFLYARMALDALEEGALAPADLGKLTAGLVDFYALMFHKRFQDREKYLSHFAPILRALVAAQGPLPFPVLVRVAGAEPEAVPLRLAELRSFLRESRNGTESAYAFYHKSLPDWLTERAAAGRFWCDLKAGHARLAEILLPDWKKNPYAVAHLISHLLAAGRPDDAARQLMDPRFLEAKVEAGLAFHLVEDFAKTLSVVPDRRLGLLEEALRRDVHFIARHAQDYPQGLFQCLWNSCWWYDTAQAESHYALSKRKGKGPLPWSLPPEERLSTLLERWRADRELANPSFVWVRSLRPPKLCLDSSQRAILRGHEDAVDCVALRGDGRRIVSGSRDHTVRVWDAATGRELVCLRGHKNLVKSVAWSGDGRFIVSGSHDKTVRLWAAESGQELLCLRGHDDQVNSVAWSGDGRRIVSGSHDKTVRLWDAGTGQELLCLCGHEDGVNSVAWSGDGSRIVSGSEDKTVRVWDVATGQQLLCLRGHEHMVTSAAWSGDGRRIVSGSWDKTLRIWDAATGQELLCLRGHEAWVTNVAWSSDGGCVLSGSADSTVRAWDADTGQEIRCLRGHESSVFSVAWSRDGLLIVSGSFDKTIRVWDSAKGQEPLCLCGHMYAVTDLTWSSDGRRVVTGSYDGMVRVWDAATGLQLLCLSGHEDGVTSVAWSSDGRRIVSGAIDKTLRVWDSTTGQELLCLRGHDSGVTSLAWSRDGCRIVSGLIDRTVRVWDAATGKVLLCLRGHEYAVTSVAWSGDGRRIVSGSIDQTVRVWDAATGQELFCLRGHQEQLSNVAWSGDGRRILSGSADNSVRVWDAVTGKCLQVYHGADDAPAFAQEVPVIAIAQALETVFQDRDSHYPFAWLADRLDDVAVEPSGLAWAGYIGNHVCLVRLEGGRSEGGSIAQKT